MSVTVLFGGNRIRPQRFSLPSALCFSVKFPCCCPDEIFQMSDVYTGSVCLPLITDSFMNQGLGKAFLVQIDD